MSMKLKKLCCGLSQWPIGLYQLIDGLLSQAYFTLLGTSEYIVENMRINNRLIKRLLRPKQIVFLLYVITNYLIIQFNFLPKEIFKNYNTSDSNLSSGISMSKLEFFNISLMKNLFVIVNLIMAYLIIMIFRSNSGDIKQDKVIEDYISNKNFQVEKCRPCNIIRVLRSYHCELCNKCVSKFELHSFWFYKDIGSGNAFIYSIFIIFLNLNLLFSFIITFFCSFVYYEFNGKEFIGLFWMLLTFYLLFKNYKFSKSILKGINENLTYYERQNSYRFPYMWKNFHRMFFNPFNKGNWFANWNDCYASYKNYNMFMKGRLYENSEDIGIIDNTITDNSNIKNNQEINNNFCIQNNTNLNQEIFMGENNSNNNSTNNSNSNNSFLNVDNYNEIKKDEEYSTTIVEEDEDMRLDIEIDVDKTKLKEEVDEEELKITRPTNLIKNTVDNISANTSSNNISSTSNNSNNLQNTNSEHNHNHNNNNYYKESTRQGDSLIPLIENSAETLVTSPDGNYYQPYSEDIAKKAINWTRYRIFTIMDVLNSPIRLHIINNLPKVNEAIKNERLASANNQIYLSNNNNPNNSTNNNPYTNTVQNSQDNLPQ